MKDCFSRFWSVGLQAQPRNLQKLHCEIDNSYCCYRAGLPPIRHLTLLMTILFFEWIFLLSAYLFVNPAILIALYGKKGYWARIVIGIANKLKMICLFVLLENFSHVWRRHYYQWKAANFDLLVCLALMAIEQPGFFSVPHLLWHGAFIYNGHPQGPVTVTPITYFGLSWKT